jgi:hypothetical protein
VEGFHSRLKRNRKILTRYEQGVIQTEDSFASRGSIGD